MANYRDGTLMYVDEQGKEHIASPGSPMFSTVTMLATHFWSAGKWVLIHPKEDSSIPDADDAS